MFESISWQEFLYAVILIAGGYYLITALLLYSSEIKSIFTQKKLDLTASGIEADQNDPNESNVLMGKTRADNEENVSHENTIDSEEINVRSLREAGEQVDQSPDPSSDVSVIKTVSVLLQEIKTVSAGLPDSGKEEITLMLGHLLSRYTHLASTPYRDVIDLFILNSVKTNSGTALELNEIKSLWSDAEIKS